MALISNWRDWWKFWSVRFGALGLGLLALIEVFPDVATTLWLGLPPDLKALFPPEFGRYLGYAIVCAGLVARVIRQRKLDKPREIPEGDRTERG